MHVHTLTYPYVFILFASLDRDDISVVILWGVRYPRCLEELMFSL